ncbi:MAG TPA: GNAT family N-acetyltransferase [Phototrophicaceae bacterium]|nr:GNAT family N-acetyltransferase [Phototrophicaceae bacterium]
MNTLKITEASEADAPLIYEIMETAFAEYRDVLKPTPSVYAETIDDVIAAMRKGGAVIAWLDDQPVGSARYEFHEDACCYIGRVSVLPQYRGQGAASAMMEQIESLARWHGSSCLEIKVRMVLESNVHLYQRLGYEITETFEHPKGGGLVGTMVKRL